MRSLEKGVSKKRYFRCNDTLWHDFITACNGRKWSEVLRELITQFVESSE